MPLSYDEDGVLVLCESMRDDIVDVFELYKAVGPKLGSFDGHVLEKVFAIGSGDEETVIDWNGNAPFALRFDCGDIIIESHYGHCVPSLEVSFEHVREDVEVVLWHGYIHELFDDEPGHEESWHEYEPLYYLFGRRAYGFCLTADRNGCASAIRFWLEGDIPVRIGESYDETHFDILDEKHERWALEYDCAFLPVYGEHSDAGEPRFIKMLRDESGKHVVWRKGEGYVGKGNDDAAQG